MTGVSFSLSALATASFRSVFIPRSNCFVFFPSGGGCSDVTKDEGYHLKTDQLRDGVRVRSLINCWKAETPVVLIAGSSYKFFPRLEETKIR